MESWLSPQLCASADVVPEGEEWILEPKIDGWRFIVHSTAEGVRAYSGRNGSDYSGKVPYIEQEIAMLLPVDSAVDGELMGRVGWGDVQGVMTRGDGPHVPNNAVPALTYVIFDVLRVNGTDVRSLPWSARRMLLDQASWEFAEHSRPQITFPAENGEHVLMVAITEGFEGLVAKRKTARYSNTRSPAWVKIKPQSTAEARVTGFKPGQGKFLGQVGALEFAMLDENDQPTGAKSRCSGFSDAVRAEITANQARWLGTIIEIKHHGLGDTGIPRHPQFLRRRDDRTTTAPPKRRTAPTREVKMGATSGRNYGAMGDSKLLKCIRELRAGEGDAYNRVIAKRATVEADLAVAEAAARAKGLTVPA